MTETPELSEPERIHVEAFGLDKPEPNYHTVTVATRPKYDEDLGETIRVVDSVKFVCTAPPDAVISHLSAQTASVPEIPDNSAQTVEGEVEWAETLRRVRAWSDRPERVMSRTITYDGEDGVTTEKFTVYHPDYIAALQRLAEVQP